MILQKWQGIEDSGLENRVFGVTQEMIASNGLNSTQRKKKKKVSLSRRIVYWLQIEI